MTDKIVKQENPVEVKKKIKCIYTIGCPWLTAGKTYDIVSEDSKQYTIIDDYGDHYNILKSTLEMFDKFELVEEQPDFSDEFEEEEWKRLEAVANVQDSTEEKSSDGVDFAYHVSQVQSYLMKSESDFELMIHKDHISIFDEDGVEYKGNIYKIIKLIKLSGELNKLKKEM